jgi:hypothetical protein
VSYPAPSKPPFTAESCRIQHRTAGIICRRNLKNLPWTVHGAQDLTPACGYAGRLGSIGYTTNPSDECTECKRDDVFASLLSHGKYVEEVDELFPTSTTFGPLASQFYAKPARRSDQRPRQLHVILQAFVLSDRWSIQHEITLERRFCSLSIQVSAVADSRGQTYFVSPVVWSLSSLVLSSYSMFSTVCSGSSMQISLTSVEYSPYSLIVYLVATAVLAATNQPIAIAPFVTWDFCLGKEELSNDQESEWMTGLNGVIVGSTMFYIGWCIFPYSIQGRNLVRSR